MCIPPGTIVERAHSPAVRVGIARDRQRVAPARADRRRRAQSGADRGELRGAGTGYLTNAVTESWLGAGAVVDHYKVQRESQRPVHIGSMHVHGSRATAPSSSHSIALGGALVAERHHRRARRRGRRLHAERPVSRGRPAADRQSHDDRPRQAALRQPRAVQGHSRRARSAVFNGKIIVRPDAQKTDAKQTNKALLLSDDAHDQHEAAARDLRRRREVHARRGGGPARRGRDLLPAGARPRAGSRRATC